MSRNIIFLLILFPIVVVKSQFGFLDSSFANNGKQIIVFDSINSDAFGKVKSAHDKNYFVYAILDKLGGPTNLTSRIFKLDRDGKLIKSFGQDGFIKPIINNTAFFPQDFIELPNGTLHLYSTEYFIRYRQNGTVDSSFGKNGIITIKTPKDYGYFTNRISIDRQNDGNYICLADVNIDFIPRTILYKVLENGKIASQFPDTSFVLIPESINKVTLNRAKIISDQFRNIYIFGEGFHPTKGLCLFILKYNENGKIDQTYGDQGLATIYGLNYDSQSTYGMLDNHRNIFLYGSSTKPSGSHYIAKFNASGILDLSFNKTGFIIHGSTQSFDPLSFQAFSDFGFVLGGRSRIAPGSDPKHTIIFYTKNGLIDSSFGVNGVVTTRFNPSFGNLDSWCNHVIPDDNMALLTSGRSIEAGYDAIVLTRHKINKTIPTANLNESGKTKLKIFQKGSELIVNNVFSSNCQILICNVFGHKVYSGTLKDQGLSIHFLPSGIYLVQIQENSLIQNCVFHKH